VPPSGAVRPHVGERLQDAGRLRSPARAVQDQTLTCRPRTRSRPGCRSRTTIRLLTTGRGGTAWAPCRPPRSWPCVPRLPAYWEHIAVARIARPSGPPCIVSHRGRGARHRHVPSAGHPAVPDKQVFLAGDQLMCLAHFSCPHLMARRESGCKQPLHRQGRGVDNPARPSIDFTPRPRSCLPLGCRSRTPR